MQIAFFFIWKYDIKYGQYIRCYVDIYQSFEEWGVLDQVNVGSGNNRQVVNNADLPLARSSRTYQNDSSSTVQFYNTAQNDMQKQDIH